MIRYKPLFESITFTSPEEIKQWMTSLSIPKRKPSGINKNEHDVILNLKRIITAPEYNNNEAFRDTAIKQWGGHLRLSKEEYEQIYSDKGQQEIIKGMYATYKHSDTGSYKRFLDNIEDIEDLLGGLKGYHRIPLKNLTVEFVSSKEMKTPAKYKSGKNTMWINPLSKKVGNTKEEYGSLRYIVVHELGHKFLEDKPQRWDISDSSLYTTKYSMADTWNDEEIFAELFALSHWRNKYKQYSKQIKEFEKRLEV